MLTAFAPDDLRLRAGYMKIALTANRATTPVAELAAALGDRGHDVSLFTRRENRTAADKVDVPQGYTLVNVPVGPRKRVPECQAIAFMGPFAQYLDAEWAADPPDIAHAQDWMAGIATQLATRHLKLLAVQTFNGLHTAPAEYAHLETTVAKTADWVTATSTDEVFELTRMGRARTRISVVPNGVDTDVFTPDGPRSDKGVEYRVVTVADAAHTADLITLVRAMPMISRTELMIVGGDGGSQELITGLGLGRRVHLLDPLPSEDMAALMRSADVMVSSAPSGISVLQAMACGVPVVAPAEGAMLDSIVDNVTGRLVRTDDPRGLANAVIRLLRDSFLRQSFGAAGRDRAHARYSWHRIAEDLEQIYHRMARAEEPRMSTTV